MLITIEGAIQYLTDLHSDPISVVSALFKNDEGADYVEVRFTVGADRQHTECAWCWIEGASVYGEW